MNLKEYIKQYIRELLDEESSCGDVGTYSTPFAFKKKKIKKESNYDKASLYTAKSEYGKESGYTSSGEGINENKSNMTKLLTQIVKEELLNEVTYSKFKNDVKYRTKSEALYKAIREVKNKLNEVDRIIDYTSRLKQELNEDEEGAKYWKRSINAVNKISEVSNKISNKIKDIYQ